METQRPGTYDEKEPLTGVISFADRRLQNARCLLWVPVLFSGVVLYFLNIHSELYYYGGNSNQLLPESAGGAALRGRATNAFLVDSPACRIPAMDPWDAQVRPFLRSPRPLDCREAPRHGRRPPPLVRANASALIVESGALSHYGLSPHAWPRCCYRHITRRNSDNDIRVSKNRTYFEKEVNVGNAEFLRVECYVGDGMIYEDYHSFIPRKPEVEERCSKILRSSPPDEDALSILLVGIDSVSRLNMHRHMPKTLQRLEKMRAIELLGYNKVGDNTFPNIVPLQSGFSVQELKAMCWFKKKNYFDSCRFLWNDLSEMGYRTSFGEDATGVTVFNYYKGGFRKQPTDYYLRTFMKPMEDKIGHKTLKRCVGSKMTVEVLLDYLFRFLLEFRSELTYSFFWSASLTHDSMNNANYADVAYADLLRRLEENRLLERTALLVLSDHGMRWGDIRRTYQGRLEERLPLAFLVLPDWFRERYPAAAANAGRNARRLTSPFDLHATLRDVVRPRLLLTQDAVRARSLAVARASAPPRGISLFLQIPVNRSCEDAGILPNWCTCQINIAIDKGSSIVNRSANVLVDHINDIVRNFSQCYQLKLDAVIDGQLQIPQKKLQHAKDPGIKDYLLVVRTSPGNALFESTIRHKPKTDKLTVIGYVSRINRYGSQSSCVSDYHVKLYCYCKS